MSEDQARVKMRTEALSLSYNGRRALADVWLQIPQGEITAILGPSGCGKTSFLYSLNRLSDLFYACRVEGNAWLDENPIHVKECDLIALRRRVGMIFQKPNPFPFSIRRNLELPLKEHGIRDREAIDGILEQSMRAVGLWDEVSDRLGAPALGLSGGQQQRLCLARALALQPEVLLLDEPCSALDPISSGLVEELIRDLRARYTIVIVTHNLAQARRLADRVAVFWLRDGAGRMIEQGPAPQIFESPQDDLTKAYMRGTKG
jgi:phosphate transport system ATP-binding protein